MYWYICKPINILKWTHTDGSKKNVGGPETHIIQGTWRKGQYGSGHAWSRQATPGYSPERETPEKFGDLTCVPGKSPGLEKNRWWARSTRTRRVVLITSKKEDVMWRAAHKMTSISIKSRWWCGRLHTFGRVVKGLDINTFRSPRGERNISYFWKIGVLGGIYHLSGDIYDPPGEINNSHLEKRKTYRFLSFSNWNISLNISNFVILSRPTEISRWDLSI